MRRRRCADKGPTQNGFTGAVRSTAFFGRATKCVWFIAAHTGCWCEHRGRVMSEPMPVPTPMPVPHLPTDTRRDQALRAANFMERCPKGVTLAQIKENCDPGSPSKLISAMRLHLGYHIRRSTVLETCNGATKSRRVRRYVLVSRPVVFQQDLFSTQ